MKLQRTSSVANIEIFRNQGEQEPLHTSLEVEGEALATEWAEDLPKLLRKQRLIETTSLIRALQSRATETK